jgi:hypothetical protein
MSDEVPEQSHAEKLATVIGNNAGQLRRDAELTLDKVSKAARMCGLSWSESRVADFESGKVAPNLATLIAFCLALAAAGCAKATLPELLRSETPIQINDSLELSGQQVINLVSRRSASEGPSPESVSAAINASWEHLEASGFLTGLTKASGATEKLAWKAFVTGLTKASGATEERTWKALGISETELADLSASLWNKNFSEERDRRAGAGANAQKRGQVSRQLRKELQAAIEAATHGNDQ